MSTRAGTWLVVAVVLAGLVWAVLGSERLTAPVGEGQPAPDFALRSLDGPDVSLQAQRGRVVLVNFWATWCKPCEEEMPAMQRLYTALGGGARFELLAISVDESDDPVRAFRERLALSFPILRDPEKRAANAYHTFRFPESWLVDADGVVVARYVGPREWDDPLYVDRIRRLMDGAPADRAGE